jgi:hypothetical protein
LGESSERSGTRNHQRMCTPAPDPLKCTGAGRGLGAGPARSGRGRPGKAEASGLEAVAEPGFRSTTFSGAEFWESAGGKTRRPETLAFFDAKAQDLAAVCRAPGKERPQTEPPESLSSGVSVVPAAVLVAMECPHLSSSVCIAPDSAKFPNGSPSSWCCSGECGPKPAGRAPEAPALPGLPSKGRGRPVHGPGEGLGRTGSGCAVRRARAGASPLFPAARRPGPWRRGPRGAGVRGGLEAWGRGGLGVWPAPLAPPCGAGWGTRGAVARVARPAWLGSRSSVGRTGRAPLFGAALSGLRGARAAAGLGPAALPFPRARASGAPGGRGLSLSSLRRGG